MVIIPVTAAGMISVIQRIIAKTIIAIVVGPLSPIPLGTGRKNETATNRRARIIKVGFITLIRLMSEIIFFIS